MGARTRRMRPRIHLMFAASTHSIIIINADAGWTRAAIPESIPSVADFSGEGFHQLLELLDAFGGEFLVGSRAVGGGSAQVAVRAERQSQVVAALL